MAHRRGRASPREELGRANCAWASHRRRISRLYKYKKWKTGESKAKTPPTPVSSTGSSSFPSSLKAMDEDNAYRRDNRARLGKYPATEPSYVSLLSGQGVPADWENPDYPQHIYGTMNESPEGVGIGASSQSVDNEEAHIFGRHFSQPPHRQAPAPQPSRARGQNFSEVEDVWLCNAWVSISTDPITGNYQGRGTYWGRITEEYNKLKDVNHPFRNEKSLTQRWSLHINPDCSRFAGCVATIERRHPSGMNTSNIYSEACTLFANSPVSATNPTKKRFIFVHAYDILKSHPKWKQLHYSRQHKRSAPSDATAEPVVNLEDNEDDDLSPQVHRRRPMGRNAAKSARSSANSSASSESFVREQFAAMKESNDALSVQRDKQMDADESYRGKSLSLEREALEKMEAIEREKLQLLRLQHESESKKLDLKEREQEMKIFQIDLTGLEPEVQEYYRGLRQEILSRRRQSKADD